MSHAAWVVDRAGSAPPALLARVNALLAANPSWASLRTADLMLQAGEALLQGIVRRGDEGARDVALDLLAADACVTWAFEAAADEPGTIVARAAGTINRISEVGA